MLLQSQLLLPTIVAFTESSLWTRYCSGVLLMTSCNPHKIYEVLFIFLVVSVTISLMREWRHRLIKKCCQEYTSRIVLSNLQ